VPNVYPEFDVLLYDYRGQGKSTRDDVPYYISEFANYCARIMDMLKIDKVHTQGVSYGGFITADFGRLHPDRLHTQTLSGILLTEMLMFQPWYQEISLTFYRKGLRDPEVFDLYTRYLYEKTFSEKFLKNLTTERVERMRKKFFENYRDSINALIRLTEAQNPFFENIRKNGSGGYRNVKAPTLLLVGEYDRAVPIWMQEPLLDLYSNSKMIIIHGCGHITYFEEPEIFWENFRTLARKKTVNYELACNKGLECLVPGQKCRTVGIAKED